MNVTIFRLIGFAVIAAFLAYYGQPFIHGNEQAIDSIIHVFAILAGFLIAIMMLFNRVDFDEDANWRKNQLQENAQNQRFQKQAILFWSYLLVMLLAFVAILCKDAQYVWLERLVLWLGCICMMYTFLLPVGFSKMRQREFNRLMQKKLPVSLR